MAERTYSFASLVILPRLTAQLSLTLATAVISAALAAQADLRAAGGALPLFLARSLARLMAAADRLKAALAGQLVPASASATRESDQALDSAWGALHDIIAAFASMDPVKVPMAKAARDLLAILFPEGLTFLTLDYRTEWAESDARILAVTNAPHEGTIKALGAWPVWEQVLEAHGKYGEALGITSPEASVDPVLVKQEMDAVIDALREWTVKAVAWEEPEEPGSAELSARLIAPLAEWGSSSAKKPPSTAPSSTPAPVA